MPPPANTAHAVFSGSMPGGEEFAFGYWFEPIASPANAVAFQTLFGEIIDASLTALTGLANTCFSNDTRITQADGYWYAGGSTKATYQAQETLLLAGTGSPSLPNQCSAVITLLTGLPGRSQRGRMYIPLTATTGDTTRGFQMSATRTQGVSQQGAALLEACNANGATAVVMSPTKGATVLVTQVRADSKIDTQRRRTEQVTAVTSTVTGVSLT